MTVLQADVFWLVAGAAAGVAVGRILFAVLRPVWGWVTPGPPGRR